MSLRKVKYRHKEDLTDEDLDKIKEYSSLGMRQEEIARLLNIAGSTFKYWLGDPDMPELKEALETGRANAKVIVTTKLFQQINEGNIVAIIFYLKTQCGWRETDKQKLSSSEVKLYLPEKFATIIESGSESENDGSDY